MMRWTEWLRPGIRVKRWTLLGVAGMLLVSFGFSFLLREIYLSFIEKVLTSMLIVSGLGIIVFAIVMTVQRFFDAMARSGMAFRMSLDADKLSKMVYEKRLTVGGPKIVVIGGGTGLSTMLRGLKEYSTNITAVVTVADDGGGSGQLRQDLGMLPPGDIRNCVLALANTEPIMQKLLQYRFAEGTLKGQSFGNLFLAAMDGISNSFEEAVRKMSDVLAVTGKVLPVTLEDIKLSAVLEDGTVISGESRIGHHHHEHPGKIRRILMEPATAEPLQEALEAIADADMIVMGPGSLYTSVIPNLLVVGMADAVRQSPALRVYVCNVMTQPGETERYSVGDHLQAILDHTGPGVIDACLVNIDPVPEELRQQYEDDSAGPVVMDSARVEKMGIEIVTASLMAVNNGYVRHNSRRLAAQLVQLVADRVLAGDKKRNLDYFFVKDRLRRHGNG